MKFIDRKFNNLGDNLLYKPVEEQDSYFDLDDNLLYKSVEEQDSYFDLDDNLLYKSVEEQDSYFDKLFEIDTDNYSVFTKGKYISKENTLNIERENFLRKEITPKLLNTILEESFEFGVKSKSEEIIEEQLKVNALATRNWLNEIFITFFNNEKIIIGILRIIGRFKENLIFPQGQTMALAALNHKNAEIKELGIRAFENWGSYNSIKILKSIKLNIEWLEDYKNQVIEDLKEELRDVSYPQDQ